MSIITGDEVCPVCYNKLYPYYPLMLNCGTTRMARGVKVCNNPDCYEKIWEDYLHDCSGDD